MRILLSRLMALFRQRRLDRELDDEIQAHLDLCAEDYEARGIAAGDARSAARRAFGGVAQMKETYRDRRGLPFLEVLWQDLRYALRTCRRSPGFAATAILSLALGLGANIAIFSMLDAVLLKTLPVHEPGDLYVLRGGEFSFPAYQGFRDRNTAFTDLLATSGITPLDLVIDRTTERAKVSFVSGSYFSALGVQAILGRTFASDDDRAEAQNAVVVLSHGFWERRFGRDPAVIGRAIRVTNATVTVLAVTPPAFFGERVGAAPDLWIPLTAWGSAVPGRNLMASPTTSWLEIIGRLKPGTAIGPVDAALTASYRQVLTGTYPNATDELRREIEGAAVRLEPAARGLSSLGRFETPLKILMGVVVLVLIVACANVSNLLIARASARQREIALRLALGVSRPRLVRQLLTESVLLALAGGAAGLALAWWVREGLLTLVSADGSRLPLAVETDVRLLAFAVSLSVLTGIVFGLAPLWQSLRVNLASTMGTTRATQPAGRRRLGSLLVVGQVAISLVLLTGAGLFLRTLWNLRGVDLGFTREQLLVVDVNPRAAGYERAAYSSVCERLLERLGAIPGVSSATFSENGVLTGRDSSTNQMRPDGLVAPNSPVPEAQFDMVGPRYVSTLGIPLVAGRDIDPRDRASNARVLILSEALARRFFGTADVVGRAMRWGPPDDSKRLEIVGVTRDVKQHGPRDQAASRFYVSYFQQGDAELSSVRFILRTAGEPAAVAALARQAIAAEDRRLSIDAIDSVPALANRTLVQERMTAVLASAFGALALLLGCIGLYGLMSYRVVQRTSEIGVRMALGAARRQMLWLTLREDLAWIAAGLVVGAPLALMGARLIRSLLFDVDPVDPATLLGAVLVMVLCGIVAGLEPAWRASRVEPAISLRHD